MKKHEKADNSLSHYQHNFTLFIIKNFHDG
jgi:hypothetical protein